MSNTTATSSESAVKLVIQIPCFNEEATLPETLADLPREVPGFDTVEWLVIDDGCTDRTVEVARENGVHHIVSLGHNRGLAAAFTRGLEGALLAGADVIVNTDADNQYRADGIADLVAPIVEGEADMVVGERPIETIEAFSWVKKRLQRLGSRVVRAFSGTDVRDAASGFRAFDRDAALRLQVFGTYSYTMETLIQAGWEDLRVTTVEVGVNPPTRPSRLVRSMPRYVFRSATTIVRAYALYRPFRFFALLGMVPFLVSAALFGRWFYLQLFTDDLASRVPSLVGAAVAMIIAVQIWVFAFVADLLSANRRMLARIRYSQHKREVDEAAPTDVETAEES